MLAPPSAAADLRCTVRPLRLSVPMLAPPDIVSDMSLPGVSEVIGVRRCRLPAFVFDTLHRALWL